MRHQPSAPPVAVLPAEADKIRYEHSQMIFCMSTFLPGKF